ncbi:MAG: hypothetical protein WA957_02875 [Alteraurantiacibacter sp.]
MVERKHNQADTKPDSEMVALANLVEKALGQADDLGLHLAGAHLDQALIAIEIARRDPPHLL